MRHSWAHKRTMLALTAAGVVLAIPSAAQATQPADVLAKICQGKPTHPRCVTDIRWAAPSPGDQAHVTAPFTLNVSVTATEPLALVRYFFRDARGAVSSANRETETGYAFVVQGELAEILANNSPVNVTACAYSVTAPDEALDCTDTITLYVEVAP